METENGGDQEKRRSEQPSPPLENRNERDAGSQSSDPTSEHPDHNKRVADWTQRLTLVTGALVFVGICQFGASYFQWDAMNQTLSDARRAAKDAIPAEKAATARQERLIAANEKSAGAARTSADAATVAANASKESASALAGQLAQQREAQRPVIEFADAKQMNAPMGPNCIPTNGRFYWNYGIKNVGQSRALDLLTHESISMNGGHFRSLGGDRRGGELGKDDVAFSTVHAADRNTCDLAKQAIRANALVIKIVVTYKDAFKVKYTTPLCIAVHPNGSLGKCQVSSYEKIPEDPPTKENSDG